MSRYTLAYILCSISELFRHYDLDPLDLLIIRAVLNANVISVMSDSEALERSGWCWRPQCGGSLVPASARSEVDRVAPMPSLMVTSSSLATTRHSTAFAKATLGDGAAFAPAGGRQSVFGGGGFIPTITNPSPVEPTSRTRGFLAIKSRQA